jgi:DNA-binding MarR family transcriptional regulator
VVVPSASPTSSRAALAQLQVELGLLLRLAHRRTAGAASDALRPLGVEGRHVGVLIALDRQGPLTQTQLVDALNSEKSAMVRTVDDLERLGAVRRSPAPSDRRARLVDLTDTGRELLRDAQPVASEALLRLFGSLSEEEQRTLHQLLTRYTSTDLV